MDLGLLNENWLRVTLYCVAATACALAALADRRAGGSTQRQAIWVTLAACVLILGFGRELEAGNWLTDRGRDWARSQGWYADRRPLQRRADLALLMLGAVTLGGLLILVGRRLGDCLPAATVLVLMATFISVRAVSYHNVDQLLYNREWRGLRVNSAVELALISAMVCASLVPLSIRIRHASPRKKTGLGSNL